ncbi:hypothetical protein ANN_13119 [Periplaneta americana]|uniref:Uncharacterized protein n=1 Tax=Periplaneta americana TaxID=6978 RepID=A0ABQ8TJI0_PERAM|nr:hypothetical protein ANN_13119 [Periplaneta americana]
MQSVMYLNGKCRLLYTRALTPTADRLQPLSCSRSPRPAAAFSAYTRTTFSRQGRRHAVVQNLFNDAVSTTTSFSVDEIGDGKMRPRIRYRLPDIRLRVEENLGKNPTSSTVAGTDDTERSYRMQSRSCRLLLPLKNRCLRHTDCFLQSTLAAKSRSCPTESTYHSYFGKPPPPKAPLTVQGVDNGWRWLQGEIGRGRDLERDLEGVARRIHRQPAAQLLRLRYLHHSQRDAQLSRAHRLGIRSRHHGDRSDVLRSKNLDVHEEVHCIADGGYNRRIDIIAINRNKQTAEIIDPTIRFEISATQPSEMNEEKKKIYESTIQYLSAKYNIEKITVTGLFFGARGTIPKAFVKWREKYKLTRDLQDAIVTTIIKFSVGLAIFRQHLYGIHSI